MKIFLIFFPIFRLGEQQSMEEKEQGDNGKGKVGKRPSKRVRAPAAPAVCSPTGHQGEQLPPGTPNSEEFIWCPRCGTSKSLM